MSFSILFFLFYSSVPPVQYSTRGGGRTQIGRREPSNVYEDPDAMDLPVGFNNQGKQYLPMTCSSFYTLLKSMSDGHESG